MYSSNRNSSFQEEMATATGLPEDVEKLLTCPVCLDVSFILLNITLRYDWLVSNFFSLNPVFFLFFVLFSKFHRSFLSNKLVSNYSSCFFLNFDHVVLTWTCKTLWFASSTVRLVLSGATRSIKIFSNWKFDHLILNKPVRNYRTLILSVKTVILISLILN